jgi:hypothetical protein
MSDACFPIPIRINHAFFISSSAAKNNMFRSSSIVPGHRKSLLSREVSRQISIPPPRPHDTHGVGSVSAHRRHIIVNDAIAVDIIAISRRPHCCWQDSFIRVVIFFAAD